MWQDFVDAAEAYALLDHYPGITICSELAQAFHGQVAHCKPAQLSRFLSAYVSLRHHPGLSLLESALVEALRCTHLLAVILPPLYVGRTAFSAS